MEKSSTNRRIKVQLRDILMMIWRQMEQVCSKQPSRARSFPDTANVRLIAAGQRKDRRRRDPQRNIMRPQPIDFHDVGKDGAWRRVRTTDTRIFNPLLYQLSYPGADAASREAGL
jgi:hypothetical protein